MEILKVNNLCKTYGESEVKVNALKNVSFSLEKGEFAAIVGESGSGKSTLLNCVGALDTPTSGTILMDGQNLFSMKEEERTIFRRRNIGFIFQSFQLVSELNVEGNFPQNDNEAMITKNAGENLGLQVGDTVTIKRPGEPELSYQISGFCNNTSKIMSEDAYGVFLTTSAFREIGDIGNSTVLADHNMVLLVQFTKAYNIQNTINRLKEDCNLSAEQISENTKLLGLLGQSSNSFMMQVYISAFVLFVLVLTAGIMMITSSLNSNVAQRTEFFSLFM